MERRGNTKRFISALLAFVMVLSLAPGSALTAQAAETGLCEHHPAHTPECGYRAASEGAPCKYDHLCDKDCGGSHARDCAYTRELEKDLCNQGCTDTDGDGFADHAEGCAFTQAGGVHTHSDSCGYRTADAGSPCAFQCGQCAALNAAALNAAALTQTPPETTAATVPEATTEATVPEAATEATVPETATETIVPELTTETTVPEATTEAATEATVPETTTEATAPETATETTVPEATTGAATEATVPEATTEATAPEATTEATVPEETLSPVQQAQAMIDALPEAETITAENIEAVKAQLTAIDNAWAELTEEEMTALDITRYIAAVEAVSALEGTAEPIVPENPEETTVPEATTETTIPEATTETTAPETTTEATVPEETLSPVQQAQAMIDALPETVTEENAEAVKAQLTAIENAWAELTGEEMTALDVTRYIAAVEAISALESTAESNEIQTLVGTGQYQFDFRFINIPSGITVTYTVRDESGNELIPEQTLTVTDGSGSATVHADSLPIKIKVTAQPATGNAHSGTESLYAPGTWTGDFDGGISCFWTHDHTGETPQWVKEDESFHILTYPCGITDGGPKPHEFTGGVCELCGAEQPVYTVYALLPGTDASSDAACHKAGADTGGLEGWSDSGNLWVFPLPASYQGEIYFQWNGTRFPEGEGTLTLGAEQDAWFYNGETKDWSLHSQENHFFLQEGEPCAVCGKTEEYSAYELYAILPDSGTPLYCFAYLNDPSSGELPVFKIPMTYNPAGYWYCQLTTDQSFTTAAVAPEGSVPVEAYYIPGKPESPPEGIVVPDPFVRKFIYLDDGSISDHDEYNKAMASLNHYRIHGTCIVCGDSLPLVAAVEGKLYTSLEEAWNAACDAYWNKTEKVPVTITLLGDAAVEKNLILSGEEFILEGGEYTVTFDLSHNIAINSGKLTLKSGTIENKQGRAVELNGGSFVMTGGTIVATGNNSPVGVWGNGGTVTISGGSVYGQKYAVQCNYSATVAISGGSFSADTNNTAGAAGLYVDSMDVKLSGGTFDSVQSNGPLVNELLETGYTYYGEDGNVVPATGKSLLNVTVKADASGNLDLRNVTADQSGPGYIWDADTHTLTLQNANIAGDIIFADNVGPITVRVEGDSKVGGDIKFEKGGDYTSSYQLTIQGPGALYVAGHLGSDGTNGNQITIDTGAVVTAAGGVSANQGAGVDGTLTVRGTLTAIGNSGPAVYIGNVVIDGGTLNVSGAQGVSVGGMPGGNYNNAFVITSGTFNANCANYNLVCSTPAGGAPGIEPGQVFNIPSGYLPADCAAQKFPDGAAVAKTEGVTSAFASGGRLTLSANQASGYTVTVNPAEGGTATASAATARESDKITMTPLPADGYHLAGWEVRTADGTSVPTTKNTFIMPASNVTVTPVFAKNGDLRDAVVTVASNGGPEIYNGRPHTPAGVTVRYNGTTLIRNRDYTVEYSNNVNAGEATVTVTGMGNYTGTASANFTIRPKQVTAVIMAYDKTYDGNTTAVVTATVDTGIAGQNLTLNGLTGTFEDPDVGDGKTVTINSVPYFTGDANTDPNNYDVRYPTTTTASIDRAVMTVTASGYTGVYDALPHGITVTAPQDAAVTYGIVDGTYNLTENPAYTDAGTYTVYYQVSKANYETVTGSAAVVITPKTVNDPTIELSPESFIYDGTAKMPSVTVKDGDNVISDREYAVSYTNNTNAGTATLAIEDIDPTGNYIVSGSRTFTISKASLTGAAVELQPAGFPYDGTEKTPLITVRIGGVSVDPSEYSIAYANTNGVVGDHTSAGTVTVTITAMADGNYSDSTSADFQIARAEIPEITLSPASAVYSGTMQKPAVRVGSLTEGMDYDISYTRNNAETTDFTNAGDIKITVTGKGNYTGTKEATYPIARAVPGIAWSDTAQELTYTGQAAVIAPPTVTLVNWEAFGGTITYSDAVSGEPYAALPTNAGTYTVKASIAETDNYTAAETATPLTLTIHKAEPAITFADQTVTYGETPTAATVNSGGGITYSYENRADSTQTGTGWPTDAGTYTVTASAAETDNYKSGSKAITLTISRKPIQVPEAVTGLIYNGQTQTGVEAGTGYTLSGSTAKTAGNYNATATLDGNHIWNDGGAGEKTIPWSIGKRDVTTAITAPGGVYSGRPFPATAILAGTVEGENVSVILTYTDSDGNTSTNAPTDVGTYTVTAAITDGSYALTGSASTDFTIAPASITGASVTVDGMYTYTGAEQTPAPTVTLGGKTLVKDTDYTVTYANNTDAGRAKVTVTGTGNYTGEAAGTFTIGKAAITDISATVNSVKAPVAQDPVQIAVADGSNYTGTIAWTPEAGIYGFNTAYTATLILTPDGNYTFDELSAEGWTVAVGGDGTASLTKRFPTTRKEAIQALGTIGNVSLTSYTDKNGAIAQLPTTVTATVETGTTTLPISWSCDVYDTTPNAENTFTWTVTDVADYDASGVTLTGAVTVTNPAPAPVTITGKNTGVTYDGSTIDVSALFIIDENAGTATYTVTNGTGTGTLAGSALTVTKAGTFTVTVHTEAVGIYDAGTATATLTVNKGTGEGSVTMEGWTYGEAEKEPVPLSDTNGIANVTYAYSLDGTTIAKPAKAGTYTVTASFGATDLYDECTASADFTIDPKPITVTITPNGGVYGGEIKAATAELKDLAAGDTVPVTLTYTGTANDGTEVNSETPPALAGTYTVTAGIPEGDYILTGETSAQFQVSRAESLLKAEPVEGSKTYGDEDFFLTVTQEGTGTVAYAGDSEGVVTVDENGKIHIVGVGTAKVTVTVAETDNYAGAAVEITLTVARKPIKVTVDSKTKIYGEPDPELTYTVEKDALVGTDPLKIELTVSGKDVGAYDITAPNAAGDNPNYEITFEKGRLTVEARQISDAQVVLGPALIANGKEQTQTVKSVTVTNSKGETLDVTCDVTGDTQTGPGGYEMTITGTGNFTGIKKQAFAIAPGAGQPVETDSSSNPVLGNGTIIVEVRRESGAPVTNLGTPKAEIVEMLTQSGDVTAQELAAVADGAELRIIFPVRDGVSADDQAKIEALARGYTMGSCFDITMYKQLGGGEKTYLHETGKPITMTVQVPDRLLNTQRNVKRTFWTVRCHDGNAEFLPTRYNASDKTLSFETDRFSGYTIVYKDTKTSDNTPQNTATGDNPRTGDNSHIEVWIIVMALSAVGIVVVMTVKRKKRK